MDNFHSCQITNYNLRLTLLWSNFLVGLSTGFGGWTFLTDGSGAESGNSGRSWYPAALI